MKIKINVKIKLLCIILYSYLINIKKLSRQNQNKFK